MTGVPLVSESQGSFLLQLGWFYKSSSELYIVLRKFDPVVKILGWSNWGLLNISGVKIPTPGSNGTPVWKLYIQMF